MGGVSGYCQKTNGPWSNTKVKCGSEVPPNDPEKPQDLGGIAPFLAMQDDASGEWLLEFKGGENLVLPKINEEVIASCLICAPGAWHSTETHKCTSNYHDSANQIEKCRNHYLISH